MKPIYSTINIILLSLIISTAYSRQRPAVENKKDFKLANEQNKNFKQDSVISNFRSKLLPIPQQVSFRNKLFLFNEDWVIDPGIKISKNDPAVLSLIHGLKGSFNIGVHLQRADKTGANRKQRIRLIITEGSVSIGKAVDNNKSALKKQAYRLQLNADHITISANAPPGLFYGVQTLLQLLKSEAKTVLLPEGEMADWPDLDLRMIYWDDAHHLERLDALKRAVDQSAHFKINAFALKLEGHFQYSSASPLVEPYALTPAEYQDLTDYAKARYVELIPYLDAPAHISFILKHPEYASLRAFPNSNYEMSVTNPKSDELLLGMLDNLMQANKGGKYIFLSTDEAYYVGKSESEQDKAKSLGGNGRLLADFITSISNYLHKKGRTVIIWGEAPLTPSDVEALPSHLINGINQNSEIFGSVFKEHGIRQLVFTSTQGVEPLFPEYHKIPGEIFTPGAKIALTDDEQLQGNTLKGRVSQIAETIRSGIDAGKSDLTGVIICGWADAGLHPETFWLGYATGAAVGWNSASASASELTERFYHSFYGANTCKMDRVYQLLSYQSQVWAQSWDWDTLHLRTPLFGYSAGFFTPPQPTEDQTLPALPIPSAKDLSVDKDWSATNRQRLLLAKKFLKENEDLTTLLHANLRNVKYQQYNLRVLLSIANLCEQNLTMLLRLERMDTLLKLSSKIAAIDPSVSVSLIDQALEYAVTIRDHRNQTLQSLITTWREDWYPRVAEANGRKYLNQVDDVKDHLPDRTIDMSYLIYRDLHFPLGKWAKATTKNRNEFAKTHHLPLRADVMEWTKY